MAQRVGPDECTGHITLEFHDVRRHDFFIHTLHTQTQTQKSYFFMCHFLKRIYDVFQRAVQDVGVQEEENILEGKTSEEKKERVFKGFAEGRSK